MTAEQKVDELVSVLDRLNGDSREPVDEFVLRAIIALVVRNPLDEDRKACQDQIQKIVADRMKV